MKLTKVSKLIFIIIWTGIFLGAACLIVRGGEVLDLKIGSFVREQISLDFIREKSTLYECDSYPFVSAALKEWPLFDSIEVTSAFADDVAIEYQEGDATIDYSLISSTDLPIITGESYYEDDIAETEDIEAIAISNQSKIKELKESLDPEFLLRNFYVVDSTTSADASIFNIKKMLKKDFSIDKSDEPQILIYHTHATTESFVDSEEGNVDESIVGVGAYLEEILETEYGYNVIHDTTAYDIVDGVTDRNKAYNQSNVGVRKMLEKYPSIKVLVDLHRDGVTGKEKKLTLVNGKPTARIMLFNGLSRNKSGPIEYLDNPNLFSNLSFSLQLKLAAMEKYPNYTTPNYLKGYRYNLHLAERAVLIELGNQNNTLQEAKNAMEPLADILNQVLE